MRSFTPSASLTDRLPTPAVAPPTSSENIVSAWIGSAGATHVLSGTSMASPLVAGAAAALLQALPALTPAEVGKVLVCLATVNALAHMPQDGRTPNALLFVPRDGSGNDASGGAVFAACTEQVVTKNSPPTALAEREAAASALTTGGALTAGHAGGSSARERRGATTSSAGNGVNGDHWWQALGVAGGPGPTGALGVAASTVVLIMRWQERR